MKPGKNKMIFTLELDKDWTIIDKYYVIDSDPKKVEEGYEYTFREATPKEIENIDVNNIINIKLIYEYNSRVDSALIEGFKSK